MLNASPSTTLLRRAAAARPAGRRAAARDIPPRTGTRACRSLTRSRAVPSNGANASDHGDGDEEDTAAKKSGDENSTPPPPPHPRRGRPSSRDTARALEALRGPAHQKIGAEYGEGFVQFSAGRAQPLRLDVDALNERLSPSGAIRLRRALVAPDEAHGVGLVVSF